jgi:hypothetical protein
MSEYDVITVRDTMLTNADFEEVASVSRAKAFATAAKRWLILQPSSQSNESSSMAMSVAQVEAMLRRALDYIAANDRSTASTAGVRFFSFTRGR